jgi:hypothetical protein
MGTVGFPGCNPEGRTIDQATMHRLVAAFSDYSGRFVLVLDDLHLVPDSRMDPPWPLARWRVRSELDRLSPGARLAYQPAAAFELPHMKTYPKRDHKPYRRRVSWNEICAMLRIEKQ